MSDLPATKIKHFERRVRSLFVEKGMFITRLDRPWMDTPFWLQGFLLKTDLELDTLRKHCDSVYIDISRGIAAEHYMEDHLELRPHVFLEKQFTEKTLRIRYRNTLSLKQALPAAQSALETATDKFNLVMDNIKDGKRLGLKLIPSLLQPMIDSIINNSDALPLLSRLRNKQNLTYFHAIDSCILALYFGRFMGLPLHELQQLATGALLLDIGKANIPISILNKTAQLTDLEYREICNHVEYGVTFLKQDKDLPEDVINMVLAHHERCDGSGYPNGLKKLRIPAYAKMAAVIDAYNAMTSQRPFCKALTPHKALQEIYSWRDTYYQPDLTEKFLHCMGIYPNGSLVEFSSGEVGVVIAQNYVNRLKPQILPLLDADKKPYRVFKIIDLLQSPSSANGKPLSIVHDLPPDAFGIDLSTIYDKLNLVVPVQNLPVVNPVTRLSDRFIFFVGDVWLRFLARFSR